MFVCQRCLRYFSVSSSSLRFAQKALFQKPRNLQEFQQKARHFSSSSRICSKYQVDFDLSKFPTENIRNFSIIAHVDHGKSTLADRLLEITGTIPKDKANQQVLDKLQVERERGITVKAQTASLFYDYQGKTYLLNLIDTPGHVDFNYEVSRSLAACQGVILLVDANQGVQAQTVANFFLAFEKDLTVIPCLNKIDLKNAQPETVITQLQNVCEIEPKDVLKISAKLGTGVDDLLATIVERIPPPTGDRNKPLKALIFDSYYDVYRGAVGNVAVLDGNVYKGDKITCLHSKKTYEVQSIGILHPDEKHTDVLYAGQVGFLAANIKKISDVQIGDTICKSASIVDPLPGFKPAVPMVFSGIFPSDQSQCPALKSAITRLTLNDCSVTVSTDSSPAMGQGWRLGFLGMLHMDVFCQRLEQEFGTSVIMTAPSVPYKVRIKGARNIKFYGGDIVTVHNPNNMPDKDIISEYLEPMILSTIIIPDQYLTPVLTLCHDRRGETDDPIYIDNSRIIFKCLFPLNEVLIDFFDTLKSVTSGYASFDYEDHGYRVSQLVKVEFLINKRFVDEMTFISHISNARKQAKVIAARLQKAIPRQMTHVTIQAAVGSDIIAREDIKAIKKDVLAKCYGGDVTRKQKLLKQQSEHMKKLKLHGTVKLPKDTFVKVLRKQ